MLTNDVETLEKAVTLLRGLPATDAIEQAITVLGGLVVEAKAPRRAPPRRVPVLRDGRYFLDHEPGDTPRGSLDLLTAQQRASISAPPVRDPLAPRLEPSPKASLDRLPLNVLTAIMPSHGRP